MKPHQLACSKSPRLFYDSQLVLKDAILPLVICSRFVSLVPLTANLSLCQDANNILAAAIKRHPSRYGGWAAVPMQDSVAAADELTRTVKQLNFVGALIGNHDNGKFYDNETYWPLFVRAQELPSISIQPIQLTIGTQDSKAVIHRRWLSILGVRIPSPIFK